MWCWGRQPRSRRNTNCSMSPCSAGNTAMLTGPGALSSAGQSGAWRWLLKDRVSGHRTPCQHQGQIRGHPPERAPRRCHHTPRLGAAGDARGGRSQHTSPSPWGKGARGLQTGCVPAVPVGRGLPILGSSRVTAVPTARINDVRAEPRAAPAPCSAPPLQAGGGGEGPAVSCLEAVRVQMPCSARALSQDFSPVPRHCQPWGSGSAGSVASPSMGTGGLRSPGTPSSCCQELRGHERLVCLGPLSRLCLPHWVFWACLPVSEDCRGPRTPGRRVTRRSLWGWPRVAEEPGGRVLRLQPPPSRRAAPGPLVPCSPSRRI